MGEGESLVGLSTPVTRFCGRFRQLPEKERHIQRLFQHGLDAISGQGIGTIQMGRHDDNWQQWLHFFQVPKSLQTIFVAEIQVEQHHIDTI